MLLRFSKHDICKNVKKKTKKKTCLFLDYSIKCHIFEPGSNADLMEDKELNCCI